MKKKKNKSNLISIGEMNTKEFIGMLSKLGHIINTTYHANTIDNKSIGICIHCGKPIAQTKEQKRMLKFFKKSPELLKDYINSFPNKIHCVCKDCM